MSRYISTRGETPPQSFADVLLTGLAPDGGLFLPEAWPQIGADEVVGFATKPYAAVAQSVLRRFVGDSFTDAELAADISAAYAGFDDPAVAPLSQIGNGFYLLELFHGPTLAFKDIALQILGRLFARALKKRGGRATVVAATSGDTGSAAIAALGGLENVALFVLHPKGRVSEVQRLQMTTSPHANVHNIALEGTFDDAQAIVKSLFADTEFARKTSLTAVNSINFARIAAQAVYYFTATAQLGAAPTFVVPTGNFGDVFAGEAAMRMGLAIEKLVVATNANDIMAKALNEGTYAAGMAQPTLSPSMDIQVASNFERALFEASDRNTAWIRDAMSVFAREKKLMLPEKVRAALSARYAAYACGDDRTLAAIAALYQIDGRLIDPHTAVALAAAEEVRAVAKGPVVVLSTAHPAKFGDAVRRATGVEPALPPQLKGLYEGVERVSVLGHDLALVRDFILGRSAAHGH
ncbi:MAG: threonine synthase [Alphaproteobacteria bacterium]|nr:threonine synthase [Alphaproteobacteria bacterium]MBU6471431.1 threonine synthase [Alphaproteobacteria bacterium]MDE2011301.1 threonine synthase [Alphaproteobacteria bacterium]MDE2073205.1 threonine synthase [Alphaproteobacteria bacterium]MDE2352612.1 threonine synthase [Alphaproteobacteria bacterium]